MTWPENSEPVERQEAEPSSRIRNSLAQYGQYTGSGTPNRARPGIWLYGPPNTDHEPPTPGHFPFTLITTCLFSASSIALSMSPRAPQRAGAMSIELKSARRSTVSVWSTSV